MLGIWRNNILIFKRSLVLANLYLIRRLGSLERRWVVGSKDDEINII